MLMSDKYRRPWSDAAHDARRLTRPYDICSAIRSLFADDVTFVRLEMITVANLVLTKTKRKRLACTHTKKIATTFTVAPASLHTQKC